MQFIGYLHLEFEGDAVYLHREDQIQAISRNAVWIDLPRWAGPECQRRLNDHYVLVQGRFDAAHRGHMGMFSGEIGKITRLESWPPALNPRDDYDCEPLPLKD